MKHILKGNDKEDLYIFESEKKLKKVFSPEILAVANGKYWNTSTKTLLSGNDLYIGLKDGIVRKVNLDSLENELVIDTFQHSHLFEKWDRFITKEKFDVNAESILKASRYSVLSDKLLDALNGNSKELNRLSLANKIEGLRKIKGILKTEDDLLIANNIGIYSTKNEGYVKQGFMHSLVKLEDKIAYVVTQPGVYQTISSLEKDFDRSKANSLIDLETNKVIFKNAVLHDGSGCASSNYIINGDEIYQYHGNYPCEKITRRNLNNGKFVGDVKIPGSLSFILHNNKVYDIRSRNGLTVVVDSRTETDLRKRNSVHLYESEGHLSMTSDNDLGLLVAEYDKDEKQTKIFSLDNPKEVINEPLEGYYKFVNN